MATVATFNFAPRRLYQPGDINLPASAIPVGASGIVIDIDRTQWLDPSIGIAGTFDISFDGGATWPLIGYFGFTAEGGPLQPPSPLPDAPDPNHTVVTSDLPQPTNPDRKIRGKLTVSGAAVRISAIATLTS